MKRFLMLVGVAAVAGAMYVAAAPGSLQSRGPTQKQFNALKKQVSSLSKSLKSLKKDEGQVKQLTVAMFGLLVACDQTAVPIDQFGDPQGSFGYVFSTDGTTGNEEFTSALDVSDSSDSNALYITGGDSTCSQQFGSLRHAAAKTGLRLPRTSAHPSFSAHRP